MLINYQSNRRSFSEIERVINVCIFQYGAEGKVTGRYHGNTAECPFKPFLTLTTWCLMNWHTSKLSQFLSSCCEQINSAVSNPQQHSEYELIPETVCEDSSCELQTQCFTVSHLQHVHEESLLHKHVLNHSLCNSVV